MRRRIGTASLLALELDFRPYWLCILQYFVVVLRRLLSNDRLLKPYLCNIKRPRAWPRSFAPTAKLVPRLLFTPTVYSYCLRLL
jgi:hypothetical protein